jgi:TolA-binding protein
MGKQWVKQQIRHDEMQGALSQGLRWTSQNRQKAGLTAGAAAAALLVGGIFFYGRNARQNAAWDRLSVAQALAYSGNPDNAAKQASELAAEYPGTPAAGYAALFAGDVLFQRGQHQEAAAQYAKILQQGEPKILLPLAQGNTALALEAAGQCRQAVGAVETYLQSYSDHYLAPQVHASLARCQEVLGQAEQAKATLQKIQLQYPDTSWAAWAKGKLSPPR